MSDFCRMSEKSLTFCKSLRKCNVRLLKVADLSRRNQVNSYEGNRISSFFKIVAVFLIYCKRLKYCIPDIYKIQDICNFLLSL